MRIAFVYPGQGAQRPGMATDWAGTASFEVFGQVGRRSGLDLATLADDAEACGASTALAQPAIHAASLAAHDALRDAGVQPDLVAGHSLGEVTAAVAAGVVSRDAGADLVAERGRTMGAACRANPGSMAAIVRLDLDVVARLAAEHDVVVANNNAPGQVVVSGDPDAVARVCASAKEAGGRGMPLDVEGAFHSPAMCPAVVAVDTLLRRMDLDDPKVPVVSGIDGRERTTQGDVRRALVEGILAPVRWVDVQRRIADLADLVIEVGPGRILAGCARRTIPDTPMFTVAGPDDVDDVVAHLTRSAA